MRRVLLASSMLVCAGAAQAQLQTGNIGGMPYYLLPATGGCSAATPCSVITYLGVQSESAGAIANDVQNYFGGTVGPHTIVIAPQENGPQDATNDWGGYNALNTPEQQQMIAVVQGVEAQMGNTVNPAASVVTGGSLGGTGTQDALAAAGPKGLTTPGVFSAGVSFDAALWVASDPAVVAALCGVPLTAVHGTADTNQSISYDQNLQSAIDGNPACGNSFTLTPIQGHGHGTWSDPSVGYQSGTGAGTPLGTIAADLGAAAGGATTAVATTAATAAPSPAVAAPTASTPAVTEPAGAQPAPTIETATIKPGGGSITDDNGVVWTITADGKVEKNGVPVLGGGDTAQLTLVNGTVWGQDNNDDPSRANAGGWFSLSDSGWLASGSAPDAASGPSAAAVTATPALKVAQAPVICGGAAASGAFSVVGGQIIAPDGTPWIGRGVNVYDWDIGDAAAIIQVFSGINFFRVNIHSYQDPSAYQALITLVTSQQRVVELEDHPDGGGGQDAPFQGAKLAAESAWYASVAAAYKNNPYVWFGTFNEPGVGNSGELSAWHLATYNAIRGTGNMNPILIEPGGSRSYNLVQWLIPSVYQNMKNVIMDPHIYGYQVDYNTDQATNDANAQAMIAAAQTIKTSDGTIGVMVAEYGNSTEGQDIDPNGVQNVTSVINLGASGKAGSAAWAWNPGGGADHLMNGSQPTSPYGQQVQLYINTSVQPCTTAQATANAQAQLSAVSAALSATPATGAQPAAMAPQPSGSITDTDTTTAATIAQADAIVAAAQAQMQQAPQASQ